MQFHLFGTLRLEIGEKTITLDLPPTATLRDALALLIKRHPALDFHIWRDGELRKDFPMYLNGRNPRLLPNGIESQLKADDVVSLFSPIASGRLNAEVLREPNFGKGVTDES